MRRVARRRNRCRNKALSRRRAPRLPIREPSRSATSWRDPTACSARPQESTRKFARQRLRPAICRSFLHPAALAAIQRSGRNKSRSAVGGPQTAAPENMEIAKALWQLSCAMLIFAGYLLFMIFVAPFGFGFATFVSAWSSFRGRSYLSATVAVFTRILLEVFGFGIWIVVASWIFGNPAQYR
jgi:hypothetical protein